MFSASGNNSVVECDLAKVEVAGSNPVSRSNLRSGSMRRLSTVARKSTGERRWTSPANLSYGWRANLRVIEHRDGTRNRILRLITPF